MALITVAEFRERFDVDSDIVDTRIEPNITAGSKRLRGWVGDVIFAQATGNDPLYKELRELLKNAEAHLAMHFAILGLNSPIAPKGILTTAMADEGREMRKYLTPDQTAAYARQYLETAEEIVRSVIASQEYSEFAVVGSDDTSCEAATRTLDGSC